MKTDLYSIEKVRNAFPSTARTFNNHSVAYFDGPGGTQVAGSVIDAMSSYMKHGVANLGGAYETGQETGEIMENARIAAAALLGADQEEIAFGANTTTLAFRVARALSRDWSGEGNIVVTELDHHANVDPWMTAAEDKGLEIRKIALDTATLTLDYDRLNEVINEETKLVAIGLASNAIGTINDVDKVIARAKEVGALVIIDAVHAVPHFAVDFKALNADVLFCSVYKFFGPHVGIAAVKRDVFEQLPTFKLQPQSPSIPYKLETGTLNFEGLIGVTAAIDVIAELGSGDTLRERIISSYELIETYENELANQLRTGLQEIEGVTLYQAADNVPKTPTVAFRVAGVDPEEVCRQMGELAIHIESGDFYAMTVVEKLELADKGGLIRAGIAPYNTAEEIDRLIQGVRSLKNK